MALVRYCIDSVFGRLSWRRASKRTLSLSRVSSALPADTDVVFVQGDVRYVALGAITFEPATTVTATDSLVTVIAAEKGVPISPLWLDGYLNKMEQGCDVYRKDHFLDGLIITNIQDEQLAAAADCRIHLEKLGLQWIDIRNEKNLADRLPPGPYILVDKVLKPVCRLYDDTQRAFLTTLKPKLGWSDATATFLQLKAAGTPYDCLAAAVPARSPEKASGAPQRLRVVVKDLFHIKGLKTSLNNRAYYDVSQPAASTAAVVESLVRDGAHILGVTKLSSMIAREEPMDAVDFQTAFNPRGDGYQSPAGSSSGSAAAVAAYEWVDCGIGTDTSGSGRRPAMVNGVWQFRPSHDLVDARGMVTTYALFDTPCIFSRELQHIKTVLKSWIPKQSNDLIRSHHGDDDDGSGSPSSPYEIIYPLDYLRGVANPEQMNLIDDFVNDAATHLPAVVTRLSIRDAWKASHPQGTPDDVDEYLKDVITRTYYYEYYHSSDEFRKRYAQTHNGSPPYVIPFVRRRWAKGAAVTPAQNKEATERMNVYREWLLHTLFLSRTTTATSGDSASSEKSMGSSKRRTQQQKDVLVILPVSSAAPNYRDTLSPSPEEQSAFDELFLPPILGSPDIAVPIGDVPYLSRVTEQTEYLPVVADLVAAPGNDWKLLAAVEKIMALSGRPTTVATGKRMFAPPSTVKI